MGGGEVTENYNLKLNSNKLWDIKCINMIHNILVNVFQKKLGNVMLLSLNLYWKLAKNIYISG